MVNSTFDDMWEELKTESQDNREYFQTAEDLAEVINRLSEERIHQGLSQKELADRCGLKQSAIARMENVKSIPRLDTVLKVANALDLDLRLENKTRIQSVTIFAPGSIYWANSSNGSLPCSYTGYNGYRVQATAE